MKRVMFLLVTIVMVTTLTAKDNYDPYKDVVIKKETIAKEMNTKETKDVVIKKETIAKEMNTKETKVVAISTKEIEEAYTTNLIGAASFYGEEWNGRRTANGEIFNTYELTAAHKTLPFGTKVKVVNKTNGKSVIVRINDRGPFVKGRTIDLSKKAFQSIASIKKGVLKDSEIDILVLKK